MAAFNPNNPEIKVIKLEGVQFDAARRFAVTMAEGHEELRVAREAFAKQAREIADRMNLILRAEWKRIVEPHGFDPIETWEQAYLMLDCDYADQGLAVLRVSPHETDGQDVKAITAVDAARPAGTLLN